MNNKDLEYYQTYFDRIIELNKTKSITMEQVMTLVEVVSHYSEEEHYFIHMRKCKVSEVEIW